MIFIDKSIREADGKAINIRFLKSIFDVTTLKFAIPLDKSAYEKYVREFPEKDDWRKLLCEEQNYLCCYCMRHLAPDSASGFTAEHIIPQSLRGAADRSEFQRYVTGPIYAANIASGVDYAEDVETRRFSSINDLDTLTKMPHVIAHHNLLAACKGIRGTNTDGCCCNHERGRDFLIPYMLIPDGYMRFRYDVNGIASMNPTDATWQTILTVLNNETLQTIRHIWYMIAKNTKYEERHFSYDTSELQRMQILKSAFKKDNYMKIPDSIKAYGGKIMGKGNEFAWKLLVDYSWFLGYYRSSSNPPYTPEK